jgi:hypothetical protein
MTHFPLNTAALCQDCSEVGDSLRHFTFCPSSLAAPSVPS